MLKVLEDDNKNKKHHLQLFAIDPTQQLPKDLSAIFDNAKDLIDRKNQLELAKVDEKHKLWATRYSVITAMMAIVLYYSSLWIVSDVLNVLYRIVGVMAGLSMMFGYYDKRKAKHRIQENENEQLDQLITECRSHADKVKDPNARSALNHRLGSMIEQLENNRAGDGRIGVRVAPALHHHYETRSRARAMEVEHASKRVRLKA
jgi:hypothetical protein